METIPGRRLAIHEDGRGTRNRRRCEALGIEVVVGDATTADLGDACIGVLWQYPNTRGDVVGDAAGVSARAHDAGALSVVAADPLALTLLPAPGTFGADICVGSMQRYGVPMGCGLGVFDFST